MILLHLVEILWNEKEERLKSSIIDNVKISNIEKKEFLLNLEKSNYNM